MISKKLGSWLTLAVFSISLVPSLSLAVPKDKVEIATTSEDEEVVSLGSARDPQTGQIVEGIAFVHYKKGFSHKANHRGGEATTSCYAYLAKDAKWKNVENWVVNTSNVDGLDGGFIFNNLAADIAEWEDAADGIVGNGFGPNILGNGTSTSTLLIADSSSPDGLNEVYFADISNNGVIAVTTVWGIFGGPTFQRRLVEWDMVFDDVDFDWSGSATGEAGKMDFENIAQHELGHAMGMGHPSDSCVNETMYRFADYGETKKRTLNAGDIAGINKLY